MKDAHEDCGCGCDGKTCRLKPWLHWMYMIGGGIAMIYIAYKIFTKKKVA